MHTQTEVAKLLMCVVVNWWVTKRANTVCVYDWEGGIDTVFFLPCNGKITAALNSSMIMIDKPKFFILLIPAELTGFCSL